MNTNRLAGQLGKVDGGLGGGPTRKTDLDDIFTDGQQRALTAIVGRHAPEGHESLISALKSFLDPLAAQIEAAGCTVMEMTVMLALAGVLTWEAWKASRLYGWA